MKKGFTLVEIAVVLAIIALLVGGMLIPISAQIEEQKIMDTQDSIDLVKEALIGYAVVKGHLPCPDKTVAAGAGIANDGLEDVAASGSCVYQEGNIPWVTLGVSGLDAWGNRIHYSVTPAFSNALAKFTLGSTGTLRICQTSICATVVANNIPAVVLSYGKDGFGAINSAGRPNVAPTSADEMANTDGNIDFVSRTGTPAASASGQFDDIVDWISPYVLFDRMVSAGKLP